MALVEDYLQGFGFGGPGKGIVRFFDVVEIERVADEVVHLQFSLRDEFEQRSGCIGVHQARGDGDVGDPEFIERQLHALTVHSHVGNVACRPDDVQDHGKGFRDTNGFNGNIDAETIREGEHLLPPVGVG